MENVEFKVNMIKYVVVQTRELFSFYTYTSRYL